MGESLINTIRSRGARNCDVADPDGPIDALVMTEANWVRVKQAIEDKYGSARLNDLVVGDRFQGIPVHLATDDKHALRLVRALRSAHFSVMVVGE